MFVSIRSTLREGIKNQLMFRLLRDFSSGYWPGLSLWTATDVIAGLQLSPYGFLVMIEARCSNVILYLNVTLRRPAMAYIYSIVITLQANERSIQDQMQLFRGPFAGKNAFNIWGTCIGLDVIKSHFFMKTKFFEENFFYIIKYLRPLSGYFFLNVVMYWWCVMMPILSNHHSSLPVSFYTTHKRFESFFRYRNRKRDKIHNTERYVCAVLPCATLFRKEILGHGPARYRLPKAPQQTQVQLSFCSCYSLLGHATSRKPSTVCGHRHMSIFFVGFFPFSVHHSTSGKRISADLIK